MLCWQTENKTRLVYVLGITQRCMFQVSSSIDQKLDSTDQKL